MTSEKLSVDDDGGDCLGEISHRTGALREGIRVDWRATYGMSCRVFS